MMVSPFFHHEQGTIIMTPKRYENQAGWSGAKYLISTLRHGDVVYAVVANGEQPADGIIFPTRTAAHAWLRENGFTEARKPSS